MQLYWTVALNVIRYPSPTSIFKHLSVFINLRNHNCMWQDKNDYKNAIEVHL